MAISAAQILVICKMILPPVIVDAVEQELKVVLVSLMIPQLFYFVFCQL